MYLLYVENRYNLLGVKNVVSLLPSVLFLLLLLFLFLSLFGLKRRSQSLRRNHWGNRKHFPTWNRKHCPSPKHYPIW